MYEMHVNRKIMEFLTLRGYNNVSYLTQTDRYHQDQVSGYLAIRSFAIPGFFPVNFFLPTCQTCL